MDEIIIQSRFVCDIFLYVCDMLKINRKVPEAGKILLEQDYFQQASVFP